MSSVTGMRLGRRYDLEERIGAGGFSEVWRAADDVLGRPVAVKLLHPGYLQHAETLSRFRAEARHAGRLSHQNIARVYDYGEADPPCSPYLVMELVDGPSLAEVLADGPLDVTRSLDVLAQTAAGLQAAHQAGLIHRDIKPANLLLSPGGMVKITDFGISHAAGSAPMTSTGMLLGTAGYLAPERADGARATAASDLYSLGVVVYECLSGAPPFAGMAVQVALAHRDRPLPPLPASVPAEVARLVAELTEKDPAARPGSAGEVARRAGELAARGADRVRVQPTQADLRSGPGPAPADLTADPGPAQAELSADPSPARADALADPGPAESTLGLMAVPAPPRRWPERRRVHAAVLAVAAIVIVVAGLVMASVIGPAAPRRPVAIPSSSSPPSSSSGPRSMTVVTTEVSSGSLVGHPVSVAIRRLRQQHLKVRVLWRHTGQQPPGMVVAVEPAGRRPVGSLVSVTGALRPESTGALTRGPAKPPGKGKGKGKGKGHGNGNGKGDGNGNGN